MGTKSSPVRTKQAPVPGSTCLPEGTSPRQGQLYNSADPMATTPTEPWEGQKEVGKGWFCPHQLVPF